MHAFWVINLAENLLHPKCTAMNNNENFCLFEIMWHLAQTKSRDAVNEHEIGISRAEIRYMQLNNNNQISHDSWYCSFSFVRHFDFVSIF